MRFKAFVLCLASAIAVLGQGQDRGGALDHANVVVGRAPLMAIERAAELPHPYHIEARHPKQGCNLDWVLDHASELRGQGIADPLSVNPTSVCGEVFFTYDGHNMRTSAGTTWQSQLMGSVSTPAVNTQCNYVALTNTAITPAEADTTLSGEIGSNGLSRAQATYADSSGTLPTVNATAVTPVGTTGSTSYWYWIDVCNQGICTPLGTSATTSSANATLSTTNYNKITFTGVNGAATYRVWRTTTSSAPSGTTTNLVGTPVNGGVSCDASLNCTAYDYSNTLASGTVAASNLTNFGKFTLSKTFTATATQSAQAFGILTAVSSGTMCFEGTFTSVTLNNADTLSFTETVYF